MKVWLYFQLNWRNPTSSKRSSVNNKKLCWCHPESTLSWLPISPNSLCIIRHVCIWFAWAPSSSVFIAHQNISSQKAEPFVNCKETDTVSLGNHASKQHLRIIIVTEGPLESHSLFPRFGLWFLYNLLRTQTKILHLDIYTVLYSLQCLAQNTVPWLYRHLLNK